MLTQKYIYRQILPFLYSYRKLMDGEPCYSLEIGYTQLKHKALNKDYAKFPTNLYHYSLPGRKKKMMLKCLIALVAMAKQWFRHVTFNFKNSSDFILKFIKLIIYISIRKFRIQYTRFVNYLSRRQSN